MSMRCVTRALRAIRRRDLAAHQIDHAILTEGFNLDVARNGPASRSVERCTA